MISSFLKSNLPFRQKTHILDFVIFNTNFRFPLNFFYVSVSFLHVASLYNYLILSFFINSLGSRQIKPTDC